MERGEVRFARGPVRGVRLCVSPASVARAFRQGVTLELSREGDPQAQPLRSSVRYMDFDSLWVAEPEGPWQPRAGERLALRSEYRGVGYTVATTFRERTTDPEPLWHLDRPADGAIQRSRAREDKRQKVWITGASVFAEAEVGPHQGRRRIPVTVVDLSAGGARLESGLEIPQGADLRHDLEFRLSQDEGELRAEIRILEGLPIERFGDVRWQYRARFVRPTEALRSQIARHVYEVAAAERRDGVQRGEHVEKPYPTARALALLKESAEVRLEIEDLGREVHCVCTRVEGVGPRTLLVRVPEPPHQADRVEAARSLTLLVHDPSEEANVVADIRWLRTLQGPLRWELHMPEEFRMRVARESVRWPVTIPDAQMVSVNAAVTPPQRMRAKVTIVNLSAGGAAFQSRVELPAGPLSGHHLQFNLPGVVEPFSTRVAVVAANRRETAGGPVHLYRCRFMALTPQEGEHITRHIFRLQAEHRRAQRARAS